MTVELFCEAETVLGFFLAAYYGGNQRAGYIALGWDSFQCHMCSTESNCEDFVVLCSNI